MQHKCRANLRMKEKENNAGEVSDKMPNNSVFNQTPLYDKSHRINQLADQLYNYAKHIGKIIISKLIKCKNATCRITIHFIFLCIFQYDDRHTCRHLSSLSCQIKPS